MRFVAVELTSGHEPRQREEIHRNCVVKKIHVVGLIVGFGVEFIGRVVLSKS